MRFPEPAICEILTDRTTRCIVWAAWLKDKQRPHRLSASYMIEPRVLDAFLWFPRRAPLLSEMRCAQFYCKKEHCNEQFGSRNMDSATGPASGKGFTPGKEG